VDARNERNIYAAVLEQCRERCLVSSLHKFHLLEMFDEVVVFAQGRMLEGLEADAELRRLQGIDEELLVLR